MTTRPWVKLFPQMFTRSLMGAGAVKQIVFTYAIAHQDWQCFVELNPALMSALIGASEKDVEDAISFHCGPDPRSHSQEAEGARLIHEGGFLYRVVNGATYQAIASENDRRAYMRQKKRESRERLKKKKNKED